MAPMKYEVEKILAVRGSGRDKMYLIKWKGYKAKHNSWEPAANTDCPDLIEQFEKRNGAKKIPPTPKVRKHIVTATPKKATPAPNTSTVRLRTRTPAPSTVRLRTRTPAVISSSSARDAKEQKSPSRGPRFALSDEEPTQSSTRNAYARISDFPDLSFHVASIKGMQKSGDNCVVYDDEGRQHIVNCKAVAKQNPDLVMDYFLSLSRSR